MTKVSAKSLTAELDAIKALNEQMKVIVEKMPDCTIKTAFDFSVKNVDKKIARFTAPSERIILDDEEKAMIAKFRAEKSAKEENAEIRSGKGALSDATPDDKKAHKKNR